MKNRDGGDGGMGGRGLIERGALNNFSALKRGDLYERGRLMEDLQ